VLDFRRWDDGNPAQSGRLLALLGGQPPKAGPGRPGGKTRATSRSAWSGSNAVSDISWPQKTAPVELFEPVISEARFQAGSS
jgi:hypothetical protein